MVDGNVEILETKSDTRQDHSCLWEGCHRQEWMCDEFRTHMETEKTVKNPSALRFQAFILLKRASSPELQGCEILLLLLLSHFSSVQLCVTPETAAHQAPPSLGFSRQEHWSGLPFPSPMHESEKWKWSHSVMSDSSRPHGLQPTKLLHPWDFSGKRTGVGCHSYKWVKCRKYFSYAGNFSLVKKLF